jgi:prepilin peptidase CpaA
MEPAIMTALLAVVLGTAVVTDLRWSRIPNWLTVPVMAIAVGTHTGMNGIGGLLFSLTGLGAGLCLFLLFYLTGSLGAGDVKLMAAVGALVGPYGAVSSELLAMIIGGAYALTAMCYQWGLFTTGRKLAAVAHGAVLIGSHLSVRDLALPFRLRYALAIVGGTLLFLAGVHPFG